MVLLVTDVVDATVVGFGAVVFVVGSGVGVITVGFDVGVVCTGTIGFGTAGVGYLCC